MSGRSSARTRFAIAGLRIRQRLTILVYSSRPWAATNKVDGMPRGAFEMLKVLPHFISTNNSKNGEYDMADGIGDVRPSQVITTFGPGAMVDLPTRSVLIGGLERWNTRGQA